MLPHISVTESQCDQNCEVLNIECIELIIDERILLQYRQKSVTFVHRR